MKKTSIIICVVFIAALFFTACAKEDLAGDALKKRLAAPIGSAEISIDVDDSFAAGEQISFDYTIKASRTEKIKYYAHVECPTAPMAFIEVKEADISSGLVEGTYKDLIIDEKIEPQECKAYVRILTPVKKKAEKTFEIITDPRFDVSIKLCKDKEPCDEHFKTFLKGEDLYLGFDTELIDFSFDAKIIEPSGFEEMLDPDEAYALEKLGTYILVFDAQKQGFKDLHKEIMFGVIQEMPVIEKKVFKKDAPLTGGNAKDLSQYSSKELFLVSDVDWKDVIGLVPVATWTEGADIHNYATLVYHREGTAFDADSVIYFMQQYDPSMVTIIGSLPSEFNSLLTTAEPLGAGLSGGQIQYVTKSDYDDYWTSYDTVVLVEDNYELALQASVYASYINAPLVIEGQSFSYSGLDVILVGTVGCPPGASVCQAFTKQELQEEYLSLTNTDKLMLVNHDDLNIVAIATYFYPEKSSQTVTMTMTKNSLAAPFLAAAKHELIISTAYTDYEDVDLFKNDSFDTFNLDNVEYLTIVASPNAIDMQFIVPGSYFPCDVYECSVDAWHYAITGDQDNLLDLAVGRIFGVTVSDTSSNIARSLFYEETLVSDDDVLSTSGGTNPTYNSPARTYSVGQLLERLGYNTLTNIYDSPAEEMEDRLYIHYIDHGFVSHMDVLYNDLPYLDNALITGFACLTCNYNYYMLGEDQKYKLFCPNTLRKGAVGYIGATDVVQYDPTIPGRISETLLVEIFGYKSDMGNAFKNMKNALLVYYGHIRRDDEELSDIQDYSMPWFTLLGDPTLKIKTASASFPLPELTVIADNGDTVDCDMMTPVTKIPMPQWVRDECSKDPDEYLFFSTAHNNDFLNDGPYITFRFEELDFEPDAIVKIDRFQDWMLTKEFINDKTYYWITTPHIYPGNHFEDASETGFSEKHFDVSFEISTSGVTGCYDGTLSGTCSVNQPMFCQGGALIPNCVECGCQPALGCDRPSGNCLPGSSPVIMKKTPELPAEMIK